jgi:hypothetical protein
MILSVDPGRVNPGISLWNSKGELVKTFSPCFKAKTAEKRLDKIWEWLDKEPEICCIDFLIVESNSIAAGKEIGCMLAGIFSGIGVDRCFVSPVHVAVWASKFYNTKLCNIPRHQKKIRTKELMEIITGQDNLTFDTADSILNYFYWYNVKRDLRHRDNQPKSNHPHQPGTGPLEQL